MKESEDLKNIVREKYGEIAHQDKEKNASSCCGGTCSSTEIYNIMTEDYSPMEGYNPDADLGLGCGIPTQFALIQKGDIVLDLGSGAGNDCFIARHETGVEGKVIGVDFTQSMIDKARSNAEKLGYNNVEFRFGDIENLPVSDNSIDVAISNCVLNLVPNKEKVIAEIYRVLKPSGNFSISDIVLQGELPEVLKKDAEMYVGCVAGAIQKNIYLDIILKTGFTDIAIQKEKVINIPDDILIQYLNADEFTEFKKGNSGIYSITVLTKK